MQTDVRASGIPQLIPLVDQLTQELEARLKPLSVTQLNWKPNPAEWSLGQCLDHIIVANTSYFAPLEHLLAGKQQRTFWERLPVAPGLFGRFLIQTLAPGAKGRLEAPQVWQPTSSAVTPAILTVFAQQQARLVELMHACASLDVEHIIVTSPAASFVTYSLLDAFRIIVVHEQHHLAQTMKIFETPGFPTS